MNKGKCVNQKNWKQKYIILVLYVERTMISMRTNNLLGSYSYK